MAESLLNIRNRIQSVESIKKITNVMKLISSSKYNSFKALYDNNLEYISSLSKIVNLCVQNIDFSSSNLPTCITQKNGKRRLLIVVSSSYGLCGSYHHNIIKLTDEMLKKDDDVIFIGEKAYRSLKNYVYNPIVDYINLLNEFSFDNVNSFRHYVDNLYKVNEYCEVDIIYTEYIDASKSKCVFKKLLPLDINVEKCEEIIEPTFEGGVSNLIDLIIPHYFDALLYQIFLECLLSEHSARKNSMEEATTSANNLLYDLELLYNKVRQQKITEEITEVISSGNNLGF